MVKQALYNDRSSSLQFLALDLLWTILKIIYFRSKTLLPMRLEWACVLTCTLSLGVGWVRGSGFELWGCPGSSRVAWTPAWWPEHTNTCQYVIVFICFNTSICMFASESTRRRLIKISKFCEKARCLIKCWYTFYNYKKCSFYRLTRHFCRTVERHV